MTNVDNGQAGDENNNVKTANEAMTALRRATSKRHDILDSQMPMAADKPGLEAYRDHLLLLRAWLGPLQPWLASFGDAPVPRDLLSLVEADLAHPSLAGLPPPDSLANLDVTPPWPEHASAAWRWGALYVVEGSQLGGAVLYKRHGARLASHPLGYFRGNGSPGPRWHRFVADLCAAVKSPEQIYQLCNGAITSFDALIALNQQRLNNLSAEPADQP